MKIGLKPQQQKLSCPSISYKFKSSVAAPDRKASLHPINALQRSPYLCATNKNAINIRARRFADKPRRYCKK